jgi:hypothetical protein
MQGIEIPIGAPLGQLDKDLNDAQKALKGFAVDADGNLASVGKSIATLERQLKTFKEGIKNSTDPSRILLLNNSIKATEGQLSNAKNAINGVGFNKFSAGSNQAAMALQNLGRVAQDAPFGFIGIQNNLNPLLESFQRLKAETGSTGGALKALVGSLTGAGGLGLALSVVSAAVLFVDMGLRAWGVTSSKTKDKINETTKSFKEQKDEFLKSPYQEATTKLIDLTTKIGLAKQGFLDKKSVLKEYNEGIGATIGKVNDLNAAEQALINNGDKYLQLMLLKAKAEFAFKKAAEQSYEIIKKQNEIEVNKNPLEFDKKALTELQKLGKNPPTAIALQTQFDEKSELKKLNNFANRAVNIAKTAQQEVIDFAKQSGFNLNDLFDIDPTKLKDDGTKKKADDILKAAKKRSDDLLKESNAFAGKMVLSLIEFQAKVAVEADKKKSLLNLIDPDELDLAVRQAEEAAKAIVDKLAPIQTGLKQGLGAMNLILADFNKNASELIENSIAQTFGNLGTAIGQALATGGNVLTAIGQTILQSLSGFLSDMGGMLIKYGTLAVLKGKLDLAILTGGPIAIGAGLAAIGLGVALKAAGGALGAVANKNRNTDNRSVPTPQTSAAISTSAAGSAQDFGGGRVVFEISGTNLIGVLNRAGAKLTRFG